MASGIELVHDAHAELGEGPLWDSLRARLLFVDILRGEIHDFDPATGDDRVVRIGGFVGAVGLTSGPDWIVAADRGFVLVDMATGAARPVAVVEGGRDDTRMNDGAVDSHGRFWAGTMSLRRQEGQGTLYRLDPDGRVTPMLAPVTTSNGIDWSPDDRHMYYADTRTRRIDMFDFDASLGAIANRRPFVDLAAAGEHGSPDGLVVDAEGFVWLALWQGGGVRRYAPDGRLDRAISLPVTYTTKCAFGGANLDELYVTTASSPLAPDERRREPHAGGIFRLRPGVRGRPANRFGRISHA